VPSRLIGHRVDVHQHADVVEVYYAGKLVERMPRLRGGREHRIDYRHVIWSLVRKPGAFVRYRYREELFPTPVFRAAYDALCARCGERADIEYVRILHLAASTLEATVERALAERLASGEAFDYASVRALAAPEMPKVPELAVLAAPDLGVCDASPTVEVADHPPEGFVTSRLIGPRFRPLNALSVAPRVLVDDEAKLLLAIRPANLLGAAWLQLAQDLTGESVTRYRRCLGCNKWLAIGHGVGREDRVFCGDTCRKRVKRAEQRARRKA
jgi:hypothetical protein